MKTLKFIPLFVSILFSSKIVFSQTDNKLFFGEKNLIHSKILAEDREYWVHLPMDYEKGTGTYPVLYITDGDEHFFLASGLIEFMSSQFIIPEFIVVAIFHKDRNHDLTPTHSLTDINGFQSDAAKVSGGGEKLLQFIEKELIIQVESRYRASSYRVLAGHSLGGLFCIYAYLTRSHLFKGFISMDPALNWDNYVCERTLDSLPDEAPNFKNKLYISSAHNAPEGKRDKGPFRKSQLAFTKKLKKKGINNTKFELFEKEMHLTVPYQSLYAGLMFTFTDYYIFKNPRFTEEISFIQEHYKNVSALYEMKIIPPENLIEMLGKYFLFDINDYTKAIEFFKLNTTNYPHSFKAFEFLAKAYEASGDMDKAILNYKRSLELNPNNNDIQKALLELKLK
ncbi:alpha/beta hydrolase-fold protein [Abyssalbus ytuae]|uniref:Alpha/beta hydrolase-fold protein n=1 Tax=Abyssalbus ytuae TaxID=2926907 RepID=A0A9E7D2G9_9FLAO|nr:alpha/beta hydrolase-fold protein [Abyssalbus ytuae]UOB18158.1 alpha/beta hydrolase-fold protein [Abyssalbus ytuae]